jgi:hypothetical protein
MWTSFTAAKRKTSEDTPRMEPTDRSNSPEIIRRVIPIATIPGTAWLLRMEEKDPWERKVLGDAKAKNAKTARNPTAAPAVGV